LAGLAEALCLAATGRRGCGTCVRERNG
jgi:hypothetical protein